jgi:hypothetical protein
MWSLAQFYQIPSQLFCQKEDGHTNTSNCPKRHHGGKYDRGKYDPETLFPHSPIQRVIDIVRRLRDQDNVDFFFEITFGSLSVINKLWGSMDQVTIPSDASNSFKERKCQLNMIGSKLDSGESHFRGVGALGLYPRRPKTRCKCCREDQFNVSNSRDEWPPR